LLPFVVLAGFAVWWMADPRSRNRYIQGLLIVAIVALIVFSPLGVYFIQHPWTFTGRAEALWDPSRPIEKVGKTVGMLFTQGDWDGSVNIPNRPALDLFQALTFGFGVVVCVARSPRRRGLLVLIWLASMLFTNVMSDAPTSFLHGLAAVPAIALAMGVGLETSLDLITRPLHSRSKQVLLSLALFVLLGIGLAWSTGLTFKSYFKRWPRSTDLALAFEENLSAIGSFIRQLPADESIYVSPFSEAPPALVFAMHGDDPRVKVYEGRHCTVLKDAPHTPLTYIVILSDNITLPFLEKELPGGQLVKTKHFSYYRVTAASPITLQPLQAARAVFGNQIQLDGYDASLRSQDGQSFLDLVFYWRALQRIPEPYTMFVHLVSNQDEMRAQYDNMPCEGTYPTTGWSPTEVIVDRYVMPLPGDLPAGAYRLQAGIYHSYKHSRLDVITELRSDHDVVELPGVIQIDAMR
jgi:hypothetical protein